MCMCILRQINVLSIYLSISLNDYILSLVYRETISFNLTYLFPMKVKKFILSFNPLVPDASRQTRLFTIETIRIGRFRRIESINSI